MEDEITLTDIDEIRKYLQFVRPFESITSNDSHRTDYRIIVENVDGQSVFSLWYTYNECEQQLIGLSPFTHFIFSKGRIKIYDNNDDDPNDFYSFKFDRIETRDKIINEILNNDQSI